MHGQGSYPAFALGPDVHIIGGSFQAVGTTVGALDRTTQLFRKSTGWTGPFAVSYAATGVYTMTLPSGMILPAQPMVIAAWPQFATLATDWFECGIVGETTLNATTKQFVIQCHRNGTAQAPANTAGNRVNFIILTQNNTGA